MCGKICGGMASCRVISQDLEGCMLERMVSVSIDIPRWARLFSTATMWLWDLCDSDAVGLRRQQ